MQTPAAAAIAVGLIQSFKLKELIYFCRGHNWVTYLILWCRHVSVTMKNYRPEMVLGGAPQTPVTEGGLAIRVGSFSGKPITPKSRRGGSNLGPSAAGPEPSGKNPKSKAIFSKVCTAVSVRTLASILTSSSPCYLLLLYRVCIPLLKSSLLESSSSCFYLLFM